VLNDSSAVVGTVIGTSVNITGLRARTAYKISIVATVTNQPDSSSTLGLATTSVINTDNGSPPSGVPTPVVNLQTYGNPSTSQWNNSVSIVLNSNVTYDGGLSVTAYVVQYIAITPASSATGNVSFAPSALPMSLTVDLSPSTTYSIIVYAVNAGGSTGSTAVPYNSPDLLPWATIGSTPSSHQIILTANIPTDPQHPALLPLYARTYTWFFQGIFPPSEATAWILAGQNSNVASSSMPISFTFTNLLFSASTYNFKVQVSSTAPLSVVNVTYSVATSTLTPPFNNPAVTTLSYNSASSTHTSLAFSWVPFTMVNLGDSPILEYNLLLNGTTAVTITSATCVSACPTDSAFTCCYLDSSYALPSTAFTWQASTVYSAILQYNTVLSPASFQSSNDVIFTTPA